MIIAKLNTFFSKLGWKKKKVRTYTLRLKFASVIILWSEHSEILVQ